MMESSFILKNCLPELASLNQRIEAFADSMNLAPKVLFEVQLAMEELFTNIVSYAFDDKETHEINVSLCLKDNTLCLSVTDKGKPFDPTKTDDPDVRAPVDERPVGKLGLFFIKKVMDHVKYERKNKANIITLKKHIT